MESTGPRIELGSAMGPYVVLRKLSHAGPSALYMAHDPNENRDVALRVLPEDAGAPAAWSRLLREARALAAVEHPGVAQVYGAGEQGGTPWIAMEFVRGTDLRRLLAERGAVPVVRALRWMAFAAEALAAAHEAGVVHRDIRPSNVMVTHDDQMKLVDFGIARRRAEGGADTTAGRRDAVAVLAYMAPELFEHDLVDERSDVWSLGCLLYELCMGVSPFARGSAAATAAAILKDDLDFPASLNPTVRAILQSALRRSPFQRLTSARELAADLRDALGGLGAEPPSVALKAAERRLSERPPSRAPGPLPTPEDPRASSWPTELATGTLSTSPRAPTVRPSGSPGSASSSGFEARPPTRSSIPKTAIRGRLKGTAIRPALAWFTSVYGADALSRVVDRASPELRRMLRESDPTFGIVPSGWYDQQLVGEMLAHVEEVAAPSDPESFFQQMTTAIARDNVNGIYRAMFRLITTPKLLEANAQRVFQTYFDEGVLSATSPRPGELALVLRGQPRHNEKLCQVTRSAIQNVLRMVGYTALVLERTMCLAEGHPHCAFEGFYLP